MLAAQPWPAPGLLHIHVKGQPGGVASSIKFHASITLCTLTAATHGLKSTAWSAAAFFTRGRSLEFSDDGDARSPQAVAGLRLLQTELQNRNNGQPLGLTLSPRGAGLQGAGQACRSGAEWHPCTWQLLVPCLRCAGLHPLACLCGAWPLCGLCCAGPTPACVSQYPKVVVQSLLCKLACSPGMALMQCCQLCGPDTWCY